jgi:hypothetical protein
MTTREDKPIMELISSEKPGQGRDAVDRDDVCIFKDWQTIGVTPLVGWVNVFRDRNGVHLRGPVVTNRATIKQRHVMCNAVDLFGAILCGAPALPGALRRGRPDLFDAADDEHAAQAIEICKLCASLPACRERVDTLPRGAVTGIVAGELRTWTHPARRRPRKQAS